MPTPFSELQIASFDRIRFVTTRVAIKGGLRDHVHEFPHSPGGKPERLGRKLYTIEMDAHFSVNTPDYPNAWPVDLAELRERFEQQKVRTLVIPTIGAIQAYAFDWDQEWTTKNNSGEACRFVFREDQDDAALASSVVSIQYQSLRPKAAALVALAEAEDIGDFFESVADLANSITTLQDQADLQGELLASKVESLANTCRQLNDSVKALQEPPHYKVRDALADLGVAAINLHEDLLQTLSPTFLFTTAAEMTILGVARAMYGTTEKAMELLKLNPIEDAFLIPANTTIRGYEQKAA